MIKHETIRRLINKKVNEIFLAYRKVNNITNGDIHPVHAIELETAKDALEEAIQVICNAQKRATVYDDLAPSWYIYTDCDGEYHTVAFGEITEDAFFTKVSYKICFDDCDDSTVHKIFYKGKEVEYAGWQRGMKFEYKDLDGNTVWVGYFENWDH